MEKPAERRIGDHQVEGLGSYASEVGSRTAANIGTIEHRIAASNLLVFPVVKARHLGCEERSACRLPRRLGPVEALEKPLDAGGPIAATEPREYAVLDDIGFRMEI